jgi:hypothetical protein
VYSYRFASKVVTDFEEKYARVVLFVGEKLQMLPEEFRNYLVNQFQHNNRRWNVTREALKLIDKHDQYEMLGKLTPSEFVQYVTCVKSLAVDWLLDHESLDKHS